MGLKFKHWITNPNSLSHTAQLPCVCTNDQMSIQFNSHKTVALATLW